MQVIKTDRGFELIELTGYNSDDKFRLVQESSAVGPYEDAFDRPGSSFLWIDEHHQLNREQVKELINRMMWWLDGNRLSGKLESRR